MLRSIRTRLLVTFISLAVGPLLLVGVLLGLQSFTIQQQQAFVLEREVTLRVATQVATFIQRLESDLSLVIQVRGFNDLDLNGQRSVLSELINYQHAFNDLALLDKDGQEQVNISRDKVIAASDLRDQSQSEAFMTPMSTAKVYYGPVRVDEATGEPLITVALPIIDARSGAVNHVLMADVRFKPIWDLLTDISANGNDTIYIVDARGKVVAHREPSVVLKGTQYILPDQQGLVKGLDGADVVQAVTKLQLGGQVFSIVAEKPALDALALAINTVGITALLVLLVLVVAAVLGYTLVRRIIEPVRGLALTAQTIRGGDFSRRADVTRDDELGELATAFNEMIDAVQKRETELREQAEKLRVATAEAKDASRLKDEFLAVMSHELRTPLNAIIGFTGILTMNKTLEAPVMHRLQRIRANGERLLALINDILDISRIESGRMQLVSDPLSIRELVDKVSGQMNVLAEEKSLTFNIQIDDVVPQTLYADRDAIIKVLTNLLSNAFKFTEKGVVNLKVLWREDKLAIEVSDTGIGIPVHMYETIFESFRQVDSSTTRIYGGSGLGLSIVRHLSNSMNGTVQVSSVIGEGSTFTVTLPVRVAAAKEGITT